MFRREVKGGLKRSQTANLRTWDLFFFGGIFFISSHTQSMVLLQVDVKLSQYLPRPKLGPRLHGSLLLMIFIFIPATSRKNYGFCSEQSSPRMVLLGKDFAAVPVRY